MLPATSMHACVEAVFRGEKPPRLPFITRIDFWHRHHLFHGTLPKAFRGLSIMEISRAVGIGRQTSLSPGGFRYHGLEVKITFNDELIYHQSDPQLDYFPILRHLAPDDRPGVTRVELITPLGKLSMQYVMNAAMVAAGVTAPLIQKHPICTPEDYRIYADILARTEYVPQFDRFAQAESALGEDGWLIPLLDRMPFQSLLLDVIGEVPLFYALHDNLSEVERLLDLLDELTMQQLHHLADLEVPYIEFNDNIEGSMTNPRLFRKYCLPAYQRYADILHTQGKLMGAHTDGNLKPLVGLIRDCGLDVCESFTPHPLTPLTFEDAWQAWANGPIIWGGIPSYYLEERASQAELEEYVERMLAVVGDGRIILGVVDAVMADNDIERLRWIAQRIS
jgi:hypothetical protein